MSIPLSFSEYHFAKSVTWLSYSVQFCRFHIRISSTRNSIVMATETPGMIVNGAQPKSAAAVLSEQHARAENLNPTVEEVPDEDAPPAPSSSAKPAPVEPSPAASEPRQAAPKPAASRPILDVNSEESFPALGSGPKPKAAANVASAWGAKKPGASPANGAAAAQQPGMHPISGLL